MTKTYHPKILPASQLYAWQFILFADHTWTDYWAILGEKDADGECGTWQISGPRVSKEDGEWRFSEPGILLNFKTKVAPGGPSTAEQSVLVEIRCFRESPLPGGWPIHYVRVK